MIIEAQQNYDFGSGAMLVLANDDNEDVMYQIIMTREGGLESPEKRSTAAISRGGTS